MPAEDSSLAGNQVSEREDHSPPVFLLLRCLFLFIVILVISSYCSGAASVERMVEISSSFRLDGAAGLGWVIADLDGDRTPDLAMDHRIGGSGNGYLYRIELRLSTGEPYGFTVSHSDTLGFKITGIDIDHDRDIDLVITGRFFQQPIGVWINDGKGHFTESPPGLFSSASWIDTGVVSVNPDSTPQAPDVRVHRRLLVCLRRVRCVPPTPFIGVASDSHPVEWIFRIAADPVYLRAPPSVSV
jgi:hypothetical protein